MTQIPIYHPTSVPFRFWLLPLTVEIKDCWARGKRDSINLLLSLTVTFTWQSYAALCEMRVPPCQSLSLWPWDTVSFPFIKLYLMGPPARHRRIMWMPRSWNLSHDLHHTSSCLYFKLYLFRAVFAEHAALLFSSALLCIHADTCTGRLPYTTFA